MARHSVAGRSTIAGTTVRGQFSLFAAAACRLVVREVGISNTTATAFCAALARFTNTTGQGTGLTEAKQNPNANTIQGTAFAGHTADPAISDVFRQASIAAAIGAGYVWTFGDEGLIIPLGTSNGLGIIIPVGTGQITDFYIDWDE